MPMKIIAALFLLMESQAASAQVPLSRIRPPSRQEVGPSATSDPMKVGYAIITPRSNTAAPLLVFETFGFTGACDPVQTAVLPATMTTTGTLFVNASSTPLRNLGIAIANPGSSQAQVDFTLRRDSDGIVIAQKTIFVPARWQTSQFVTELFADKPNLLQIFTAGTLSLTSSTPVAVLGLRFRGQTFSVVPVWNTTDSGSVPIRSDGVGGGNAVILPQFAVGGGWSTEFVVANSGATDLFVRLDLFGPTGGPLTVTLNGTTASTFLDIRIKPGGVVTFAPRDSNGDSGF